MIELNKIYNEKGVFMKSQSCKLCYFSRSPEDLFYGADQLDDDNSELYCCYDPPIDDLTFPIVKKSFWCGKFTNSEYEVLFLNKPRVNNDNFLESYPGDGDNDNFLGTHPRGN